LYRHLADLKRKIDELVTVANQLYPELEASFQWGLGTVPAHLEATELAGGRLLHQPGASLVPLLRLSIERALEWYEEHCRKERQSAVWDTIVDAVVTIDERGAVLDVNPGCEKLLGYAARELIGQNVSMLMPSPYAHEHDGYLQRFRETGHKNIIGIGRRVPARRKDGTTFPAHLAVTEQWIDGKRHFTGVLRDISDVAEARTRAALEERKLLSRELHDSVSQALFGIVLGTQAGLNAIEKPAEAREALHYVLSLAESGLAEMRALIFELRPEAIENEGLLISLRRQGQALAGRYQLQAHYEFPDQEPRLAVNVKHEAYRFVMEALHNVVKHARASAFWVAIQSEANWIRLQVRDDGIGFDPSTVGPGHVGLHSMRERAAGMGGTLVLDSPPGGGARLEAVLMGVEPGPEP